MVNISSGYHHPHSHNEVVHLDELSVAMQLAYELSIEHGDRRWPNEPVDLWHSYSYSTKSKTPYYFEDERLSDSEERSYGMALMSRDDLIDELLGYGYDPDLHGLEKMTRQQLIELLDECSPYGEDELPELTLTES